MVYTQSVVNFSINLKQTGILVNLTSIATTQDGDWIVELVDYCIFQEDFRPCDTWLYSKRKTSLTIITEVIKKVINRQNILDKNIQAKLASNLDAERKLDDL